MRFRIIQGYKNLDTNEDVLDVNRRLEYFHHYWKFLFAKNRGYVLISDEKFESHRSLIEKIKLQLRHNQRRYANILNLCFAQHEYFSQNNIIIRNSPKSQILINGLRSFFSTNFIRPADGSVRNNDTVCLRHLSQLETDIIQVEKALLKGDYLKRILKYLSKELHKNKPLNTRAKSDIKFLINAAIIELYTQGYNVQLIENIPDIILFPSLKKYNFPFEKNYSEFKNHDEYEKYVDKEVEKLNLDKQINSLIRFSNRSKLKGYFIFKIDGVDFENKEPIKIWNTVYYNPQNKQLLNYSNLSKQWQDYVLDIEKYFDQYVKEDEREIKKSTCNVIVEVERRPLYWDYPDKSFYSALDDLNKSLKIFRNLYSGFVANASKFNDVNLSTYIIADENLKYVAAPTFIKDYKEPFTISDKQRPSFEGMMKGINKLNVNNGFHQKLMRMYSHLVHVQKDPLSFNFKDYWTIFCESLFPSDPNKYIEFSKFCLLKRLDYNMFVDAKIFLGSSLKSRFSGDGMPDYFLDDKAIKAFGLDSKLLKVIRAEKFERVYPRLIQYLDIELIKDIVEDITLFKNIVVR